MPLHNLWDSSKKTDISRKIIYRMLEVKKWKSKNGFTTGKIYDRALFVYEGKTFCEWVA